MTVPVRLAIICCNYNNVINFKFDFAFHNILIYNRATFNNRVVSCTDFVRESWQPVKASCKEIRISVLKILTNHKT